MYVSFGKTNDWADYTLILPAIAIGNVGQLSTDLLLSTLNCTKVGCFYDKSLMFLVGNDPYQTVEEGQCHLATGMDVYENIEKKLVIIQQRVPVLQNKTSEFRKKLIEWIKNNKFEKVILLSSCSTHSRTDSQLMMGCQFRYLTTPKLEESQDLAKLFNWKRLELRPNLISLNETMELYVPGGGLTKRFYQDCCNEDVNLAVLLLFCSEGDNRPEAFILASYLNEWLSLVEIPKNTHPHSAWTVPPSWNHLFGNDAPVTIY